MNNLEEIFEEIRAERKRQHEKFGEQNPPCLDPVLLNFANGFGSYAHIALEEFSEVVSAFDDDMRREELVQLATVIVAWIDKIDRNDPKKIREKKIDDVI